MIKTSMTVKGFAPQNPFPVYIQKQYFSLIISRSGEFFVLEFEPEFSDLRKDLQQSIGLIHFGNACRARFGSAFTKYRGSNKENYRLRPGDGL